MSMLRAVALAGCAALVTAGVGASVVVTEAPVAAAAAAPFTLSPSYGRNGDTVVLTAQGATSFAGETSVTFDGVPSPTVTTVDDHTLTAVVPDTAATGPVAVVEGLTSITGPVFTVQQGTTATSALSHGVVTFPHHVRLTGHERGATDHRAVVGQPAVAQRRVAGHHAWVRAKGLPVKHTGAQGGVHWSFAPRGNAAYRVYFRGSHAYAGQASPAQSLRVRPRIHLHPMNAVPSLATSTIRGTVRPHLGGPVYLQRKVNGHWRRVQHVAAHHGRFAFSISPGSVGRLAYRVVRRHDRGHLQAQSRPLVLQVVHRTLSLGSSGPDVLALQKRLRHLHYDVGPRNGQYGYDTLHAVTAFEKVNRLAKDGRAGPTVWSHLNNPRHAHLRHPDKSAALAVEVNIARQVLLIARHGKIWRILDTSTGGGYTYTNSAGQAEQAITPTGHFTIQYKQTGWQHSQLGELYYPSYFTNTGYAIHGEGNSNASSEVPPYPNSHGCVRISNNAVLRYYDLLKVGTSVWVYR